MRHFLLGWVLSATFLFTAILQAQDESWFNKMQWREIGPTATGGRVTDIAVNPKNDHHIFVASASGGLWETKNNGTTWECIFENEGTISIGDIALDPQDTETIWIGTGEANNQRSSFWGDGIYKSTDGGKTWKNTGLPESHHIGRIVVHPDNSDTVFVAALGKLYSANPERGLYRTTDGGQTWELVLYVNEDVGVVDVAINPDNPDIVLAASYERRRRAWNFDGAGPGSAIHRSEDGGKTWKKVTEGLPEGEIGRIGFDFYQKDPNIVFATVSNQNLATPRTRSGGSASNAGEYAGEEPGEFMEHETDPGNGNFQEQEEAAEAEQESEQQQADENDQQTAPKDEPQESETEQEEEADDDEPEVIESLLPMTFEADGDLKIKSIRANSGIARNQAQAGDQILEIGGISADDLEGIKSLLSSVKPDDQIQVVVVRNDAENRIAVRATDGRRTTRRPARQIGGEIYRSEDAGLTWEKVNERPVGGNPAYYYGQIRVDPSDDKQIYILSVPMYVSSDGGKTFQGDGARSVHVDHHALWVNPDNPNHLMLGNDGGFHITYDRCKTWDYVFNLPLAQFYAITVDMRNPYHVYGGLQDNGSWGGPNRASGGGVGRSDWYRVGGGDGFYVQVDPDDHNILIGESQFGAIYRSNRATGESRSIRPPRKPGEAHRYNWNSPILMSSFDSRVIYFGGNKLFKSFNRGDDWLTISPDLTTNDPEKIKGNVPYCTITTIAESKLNKDYLLVGTDDGKVQLTKDGGDTWEDLSGNFPFSPANWWCSRVEFCNTNQDSAYVSFTGFREDDFRSFVFKTEDAGQTWKPISNGLPAEPVNVIKQDPMNATTLYVGTEFGVYVSLDDGKNWFGMNQNLPRVSVQDLVVHSRDNEILIGTHGRGIFAMDDITPLQHYAPEIELGEPMLFPVDDLRPFSNSGAGGWFGGDRKRTASDPRSGTAIWFYLPEKVSRDEKDFSLKIINPEGDESNLTIKRDAGLQSLAFPRARANQAGRQGGRGQAARRFRTPAGTYRVILTVGETTMEQTFDIKPRS